MAHRASTVDRRHAIFQEAAAIIERDYSRPIGVSVVAAEIATSRRQLQRVFAEVGGTSFRSHVTRVRMARALELLQGGRVPVRQVARRVGYRQPAQFAKAFRRHYGAPPSTFRPTKEHRPTRADVMAAEA